jgi:electron transfer flavoprotein alpha subunit
MIEHKQHAKEHPLMEIPKSDAVTFAERVRLNQQKLAADLKPRYDFIICGAGTSGSVVAARLAADLSVPIGDG